MGEIDKIKNWIKKLEIKKRKNRIKEKIAKKSRKINRKK